MGSLPQETVLHKLLQQESFPRAAAPYELLQRESFPRGAILQEQAAPAWVLHGFPSPASKPAPSLAPLSMGQQVLAGACSRMGFSQDHSPHRAHALASMWRPPWAARGYLLHCGPLWTAGLQLASLLCMAAREPQVRCLEHLLPLLLTLMSAEFSLLFQAANAFK